MKQSDYTQEEKKLFRKLNTPAKIQDFLNLLPFNFSEQGVTLSPRGVLEKRTADCFEGAVFASAVLEFHGGIASVLDLRSTSKPYDYDHVVAVFNTDGHFGAISKTNHGVLRYREPVYKSVRELVMSYFHEYFLDSGQKTLREYALFDLSRYAKLEWRTVYDISDLASHLDAIKHIPILSPKQIKNLRKADKVEIEAGKVVEYRKK